MRLIHTVVEKDHLERFLRMKPQGAIAELIWNSVDADATRVTVEFEERLTLGITAIVVRDNGTGIRELDAESGFGHLGGSWKRVGNGLTRRAKRNLHGKEGQGRFAAFALGSEVEWRSTSEEVLGEPQSLSIAGNVESLGTFRVSDVTQAPGALEGTEVRITGVNESANVLKSPAAREDLLEAFALYLRQYPDVEIVVDGFRLDPQSLQVESYEYDVPAIAVDGRIVADAKLVVVEWRGPTTRSLFLCNAKGIARTSVTMPTLRAPGFEFTAYLKSDYVQELWDTNELLMGATHPGVVALTTAAVHKLRDHFRQRASEHGTELVDQWKREGVYPFEGEPETPLDQTERKVFDVVAVSVNEYLPSFSDSDIKNKQFSLRLLRQAIESNPESMQKILGDVLGLPKHRQDELASLLEKTSLSAIIAAAKLVADRLDFLRALEAMLFEQEPKRQMLERRQLHRLLADHTWIFGEQYNLSADDESLEAVLKKHVKLLGRDDLNHPSSGGPRLIVDMMMSKQIPQPKANELEHLIVELKRPSQRIDEKVYGQINKYALAVANDERFRDVNTTWTFWALSTARDDYVNELANQPGRARGILLQKTQPSITVWAKTWGELINENRARLEFFRKQLDYNADRESALEHLRKTHEKYFPPALRDSDSTAA